MLLFLSTPSARRATFEWRDDVAAEKFLSTPSARRATARLVGLGMPRIDFYPRPPRGGRPAVTVLVRCRNRISIHALREEGDSLTSSITESESVISIHALREEGDAESH